MASPRAVMCIQKDKECGGYHRAVEETLDEAVSPMGIKA